MDAKRRRRVGCRRADTPVLSAGSSALAARNLAAMATCDARSALRPPGDWNGNSTTRVNVARVSRAHEVNVLDRIRHHPVAIYFVLTFALSWGGVVIVMGPQFAPPSKDALETTLLARAPILAG